MTTSAPNAATTTAAGAANNNNGNTANAAAATTAAADGEAFAVNMNATIAPAATIQPPLALTTTTAAAVATRSGCGGGGGSGSGSMQSDEDFNIRFVNLVRTHKCLYDKKVPEYRNRDNQEKAWSLISQETRESVIHCKERWRNLRACLSRYIKQQSGADPQHKPYYLTEHMAFLLPFLKSTRNSLDNNSLAALFHISQQQQQQQQLQASPSLATLQVIAQPHLQFGGGGIGVDQTIELKHSLSDNEDEETIDAFDPVVTASLQRASHVAPAQCHSPPLSDTGSANTMQNFIPDVQLAELRTPDVVPQDIAYVNTHHVYGGGGGRRVSRDLTREPKRIKSECHESSAHLHSGSSGGGGCYSGENADMEFFRSILPDIAALTPQQKRKFKIGILELIDDVIERFPAEQRNSAATSSGGGGGKHRRRSSAREWRH